jgi:archaemetzincin
MRKLFGCWLLVLLALLPAKGRAAPERPAAEAEGALYIQPLGPELPAADVALVLSALTGFYKLGVKVLPPLPLPAAAYYVPRRRYRAEKLLRFLAGRLPADGKLILGLTGADTIAH